MLHTSLAVEPDQVDRHLLKKILTPEFRIFTLSSAREALAFARCNSFGVAIINQKLINHFDGVLLLRRLKQLNTDFIPIATTLMSDPATHASLTAFGFHQIIRKPVTNSDLLEFLRGMDSVRLVPNGTAPETRQILPKRSLIADGQGMNSVERPGW